MSWFDEAMAEIFYGSGRIAAYESNKDYAKASESYQTSLGPDNEKDFRKWLAKPVNKKRLGEFDPDNPTEDYDLRGWWKENGGIDAPEGHFTDKFKTPYHQTFSNQSMYSLPGAPRWERVGPYNQLIDDLGNIRKFE